MIRKRCFMMILTVLLCLFHPLSARANSAEPPGFTVIVLRPPADLSLSLQLSEGMQTEPILLNKEVKAWEAYYRFFYHTYPGGRKSIEGAVLTVEYDEVRFQCVLPAESFRTYNNLFTLDIKSQTIVSGQPVWRIPALVAVRVLLTLILEGFIFFLFGYRQRKSWFAFVLINLATQGVLNALLTGPMIGSYWIFGYIFGEVIVFAVEMIVFARWVREFSKGRAVFYAVAANAVSLVIGGLLITYLPI